MGGYGVNMRYWKRVDAQGNTTTVESYSHHKDVKGAIEVTEQDFNDYLASLPPIVEEPPRDLLAEIDELKVRMKKAKI